MLAVKQFDPTLGTLQAVNFTLTGDIQGTASIENMDTAGASVSVQESAAISLVLRGEPLLTVSPTTGIENTDLSGYDGTTDFSGTSGTTLTGFTSAFPQSAYGSITDPGELAAFVGTGTDGLPIYSTGSSTVGGSANLLTQLSQDAGATIEVTYLYTPASVACFASGTCIATPDGPVAVEDLIVGQIVFTQAGRHAPIAWIGHRFVDCIRHPDPAQVHPVRIRADAFAPQQPERDLFLSPDHAVAVEDVLIRVSSLINGQTISRAPRETVTYWHVELDRHDVMLAEGLPVESFLDTGNRAAFANGGPAVQLHPSFASWRWEAAGFAPLVVIGPVLDAARARLADRIAVLSEAA